MKQVIITLLCALISSMAIFAQTSWVRVDQPKITANAERWGMKNAFSLNFSDLAKEGRYYAVSNGVKSRVFKIDTNVYDGTASLEFYLSTMEELGKLQKKRTNDVIDPLGATIRKNINSKEIRLIFSADGTFEGAPHILKVLDKHKIKGSFFLTGNALRNNNFNKIIKDIIKKGHYLGGHSDNHLLYAEWGSRESLVTTDSLLVDLRKNYDELNKWGITDQKAKYYLPPYEHYNAQNVKDIEKAGVEVINYTAGIRTPADYTTPDMKSYMSSQALIDQLYQFESEKGLGGAIILFHPGTVKERTDKLYNRLDEIVTYLKKKGYKFVRF